MADQETYVEHGRGLEHLGPNFGGEGDADEKKNAASLSQLVLAQLNLVADEIRPTPQFIFGDTVELQK